MALPHYRCAAAGLRLQRARGGSVRKPRQPEKGQQRQDATRQGEERHERAHYAPLSTPSSSRKDATTTSLRPATLREAILLPLIQSQTVLTATPAASAACLTLQVIWCGRMGATARFTRAELVPRRSWRFRGLMLSV